VIVSRQEDLSWATKFCLILLDLEGILRILKLRLNPYFTNEKPKPRDEK
jgi:hypothetical protein